MEEKEEKERLGKKAIFRWIDENHNDPITREFLSSEMLVEDLDYKRKIYKKAN